MKRAYRILVPVMLLIAFSTEVFAWTPPKLGRRSDKPPIGELHNQGVQYVLTRLKRIPQPEGRRSAVIALTKDYLRGIGQPESDIAVPKPLKSYDDAIALVENIHGSEALKEAFRSLLKLWREHLRLPELNRALSRLERENTPRIKGKELKDFSQTISLARSSATFWAPVKEGGRNGIKYLNPRGGFNPPPSELPVWGWDCVGYLIGAVGGAIACSALACID